MRHRKQEINKGTTLIRRRCHRHLRKKAPLSSTNSPMGICHLPSPGKAWYGSAHHLNLQPSTISHFSFLISNSSSFILQIHHFHKSSDLLGCAHDFLLKPAGGDTDTAVTHDNDLLQRVGGGNADTVLAADVIGDLFDIGVGGLVGARVDDVHAAVALNRPPPVLDTVGIKDENQIAFFVALIVGKNVNQGLAGKVQRIAGKGLIRPTQK